MIDAPSVILSPWVWGWFLLPLGVQLAEWIGDVAIAIDKAWRNRRRARTTPTKETGR